MKNEILLFPLQNPKNKKCIKNKLTFLYLKLKIGTKQTLWSFD